MNKQIGKKQTRLEFEVVYNPKIAVEMSDVMAKFDIGVDEVQIPITEVYSWFTTSKVDEQYIQKAKKAVEESLDSVGRKLISFKRIL
jgi:hypothetical protein